MSLTLGLTGMDPATETALKAAFTHANAQLDGRWTLAPETEAEHVMVDMDSMYGPMSWLRLHAAGKKVIGLTTAPRTQTDFRLGRPFDAESFSSLLLGIASEEGVELAAAPAPADASTVVESASTPPPPAAVAPLPVEAPAPAPSPAPVAVPSAPAPQPVPASAARDTGGLADWLAPGALSRRVRYRASDGTTLLIDPAGRSYHGPSTLKPLAGCFDGVVRREDLEDIDDAAWARESAAAGAAQPLQRLQWLGGLVAGKGSLLPGHDADGRFRLNKWPQTEREYPKHFRIATAMMKGPATLAEIAEGSGMPVADVADFVNANLVTGFAEPATEAPPEPTEAPKATGLFGRLRGR
jgi:hypothetical protein